MAKELTPKQQMFCKEYLIDLNATQAAIRAGYSEKTSSRIGPELLGKTWIQSAIQAQMDKRAARVEVTADDVLTGIQRVTLKAEEAEEFPAALKGFELLGKHLKLFTDKIEHSLKLTLEDLLTDER